jgi:hypothetical protein
MAKANLSSRLSDFKSESDVDHNLQNLLQALTLNLELRSRYRVYEFEARTDGAADTAAVFRQLVESQAGQIAELLSELRRRLTVIESTAGVVG